jgi:hypothetical protein
MNIFSQIYGKKRPVPLAVAIERTLSSTENGELENLRESNEKCKRWLGKLTAALHEKGLIPDELIKKQLEWEFIVEGGQVNEP